MKKTLFGAFLASLVIFVIAATFPINNGVLQSDLNGNQKSITNLLRLDVTTLNAGSTTFTGSNFTGTFFGNGAGITNIPFPAGNALNVLLAGAKGGTNDDTAVLQGLLNAGGQLYFPPTNYTVTGIWVTNNLQMLGYGATINLKLGVTNIAAINWPNKVPPVTNVVVQGFKIAGGDYSDCTASLSLRSSGSTNRMGINTDINSVGSVIQNINVTGLDKGISVFGNQDNFHVFENGNITIQYVEGSSNYFGLYLVSTNAANSVEYFTMVQMRMHGNTYGALIGGGNIGVMGSDFVGNCIGINVSGKTGINPAHGLIIGNKINHNTATGIYITDVPALSGGEIIANNDILANGGGSGLGSSAGSISISNSAGVQIEGNNFGIAGPVWVGAQGVSAASVGPNFIVNNHYSGTWGGGLSGFSVGDWKAFDAGAAIFDQTTNLVHYGNRSSTVSGDADPYTVNPFQTNSINANHTNSAMPIPMSGTVITWYSNYDTWQITPFKTNRIAQGQ